MISRDCIITVNGNKATIDSDIYLYKYDKNIQLAFTITNSKYMYDNDDSNNLIKSMQAAYAQVKFKKDDSADIEIEFDIQATREGAVLLTINEELTDEDTELGEYTIQIRLLDSNKNSVVTLPPVESCIHIQAPLFEKMGSDTNVVNKAVVNKAVARYAAPLSATTADGTFNSKEWVDGDKITTAELNRMEQGIKTNSIQYKDIANYSLTKGTDGKVYIKKQDGTLIGEGIEVGSNVDLSKITMSVSGQTLKLMNGEEQVASVDLPVGTGEIPDNTVLYEEDSESTGDVITAENITIKDASNNFTGTNVEGALSELFQSASNGKKLIATAITGKGVETSNTDSFQTMATNINNIKVGGGGITPTGTKEITQNGTYDVTNFASVLVNVVSQGSSSSGNSVESGTITPEEKSTDITINTSKKCSNLLFFQHVLGTGTGYRTVVGLIRLDDFRTNLTSNSTGATLNVIATSESQINAATVTFRDNGIDVHLNSTAAGGGYLVSKPHVWYAW